MDQKWLAFADEARDWYLSVGFETDPERLTKLSSWVRRQRSRKREARLPLWQIEILDAIPGWTWVAKNKGIPRRSFVERELGWFLAQMLDESARHGSGTGATGRRWNCDIVFDQARVVVEFDGRFWHRGNERADLDRLKTLDLEAAGWLVIRVRESPLPLLTPCDVRYLEASSTAHLADQVGARLLELGIEVKSRRRTTDHRPSHDRTYHDDWYDKYQRFLDYVSGGGTPTPPISLEIGEFKVGQWVGTQRRTQKNGRLSSHKHDLLTSVPGWEWQRVEQVVLGWEAAYESLCRHLTETGRIPTFGVSDPSGFRLGHWAAKQRQFAANGTLAADRFQLLDALPGWEWVRDRSRPPSGLELDAERWRIQHHAYVEFVAEHGHHPRGNHQTERPLAGWAATQRIRRREGGLDAQRDALLQAIPGWSWGRARKSTVTAPPLLECDRVVDEVLN